MKSRIAAAIAASVLIGCGAIPKMAPMLNVKGIEKEVDADANGFIAFESETDYGDEIRADVKNLDSGKKFRITLNPSTRNSMSFGIGPFTVAERKSDKDLNSKTVFVFQLPPGRYRFQYLYPAKKASGKRIDGAFEVGKSEILSFGKLDIGYTYYFTGVAKSLKIESGKEPIDEDIKRFEAYGINKLAIKNTPIAIGF